MGAGEFLLAMWQSPLGACVSACVVGLGYGIYLAVDQALTADVLPRPTAYGRDMGWMNVANVLPQIAAPLVASAVLDVTASYRVLYIAASALAILTIFMVSHIRSVS
jgi:MFS family permease